MSTYYLRVSTIFYLFKYTPYLDISLEEHDFYQLKIQVRCHRIGNQIHYAGVIQADLSLKYLSVALNSEFQQIISSSVLI